MEILNNPFLEFVFAFIGGILAFSLVLFLICIALYFSVLCIKLLVELFSSFISESKRKKKGD